MPVPLFQRGEQVRFQAAQVRGRGRDLFTRARQIDGIFFDNRCRTLLELNFDELFDLKEVEWKEAFTEMPMLYCTCQDCGQEVLLEFAVEYHDSIYCMRCFQRINTKCIRNTLQ